MNRDITITFRANPHEYQLVQELAKQMERTPSDALRILVRRAAKELGVSVNGQKAEASGH